MDVNIKPLLIFLSIFLGIFVFYRLIVSRLFRVSEGLESKESYQEASSQEASSALADNDSDAILCQNDYTKVNDLPLKEYTIKSSFNSAYNGSEVTKDTLEKRLAEGYRFIDLNVFSASGGILYVGFSRDNNPTLIQNTLLFSDALQTIHTYAFTKRMKPGETSVAYDYLSSPLFLNIRVYRPQNSIVDVVDQIWSALDWDNQPNYYKNEKGEVALVNGCTSLSAIGKKIVISMDIENIIQIYAPAEKPIATEIPTLTQKRLKQFVGIYTGGNTWRATYKYTDDSISVKTKDLKITDQTKSPYKTNITTMHIVYPYPDDQSNPDFKSMILKNSLQTIPFRVYLGGGELTKYEKMFADLKTSFVPMAYAYTYLRNPVNM